MSDARNLGETAFVRERGQPSAEIVRVGCAKPRRNCVTRCAWSTLCGDRACQMCEMYAVPLGHWNALIFVFANVSYETLILEDFWEIFLSVFANVSYETLILEGLFPAQAQAVRPYSTNYLAGVLIDHWVLIDHVFLEPFLSLFQSFS